jgi:hypothetical protein
MLTDDTFLAILKSCKSNAAVATAVMSRYHHTLCDAGCTRLRQAVKEMQATAGYEAGFTLVKAFLDAFEASNDGTKTSFQVDEAGVFQSLVVVPGQALDIVRYSARPWFETDATHNLCQRWSFKIYILTVTDGNNKNIPIAFGMYAEETIVNYCDFFETVKSVGGGALGELLNRPTVVIATDRHSSLPAACAQSLLLARRRFDVRHIHENIKANCLLNRGPTGNLWQCHKATTKVEFDAAMAAWSVVNAPAAKYAAEIPAETWATYTVLEGPNPFYTFGLTGQQAAEQEMARLLKAGVRHQLPLHALANYINLFASVIDDRIKECYIGEAAQHRDLTIFADMALSQILHKAPEYKIKRCLGNKKYEVQHHEAKAGIGIRTVNWGECTCTCNRMLLTGLPCEHLVSTYKTIYPKATQTTKHFLEVLGGAIPDFYWAKKYALGYLRPVTKPNLDYLVADGTVPPSKNTTDRGKKRKQPWTERVGAARPTRALRQSAKLIDMHSIARELEMASLEPERTTRGSAAAAAWAPADGITDHDARRAKWYPNGSYTRLRRSNSL